MAKLNIDTDMLIAEDSLIADVQFTIHNLLEQKGVSRAELARRLSVSEAYVSQLFSDVTRNLTLRTIARVFKALGETPCISCDSMSQPYRETDFQAGLTKAEFPA